MVGRGLKCLLDSLWIRDPDGTSIGRHKRHRNGADATAKNKSMGNSLGGRDADQADRAWPGELVDISSRRLTQGMPINQELKYGY